ncbi:hypothetical protein [Methylobacterium gnaphalii]|uniref:Uncharacterized protein n=1 Tax=Methylobacterium gnaphalii TaxID=1010610 RepID=A0A512JH26_9HYPH|nr:hypothetical protein [Methylobacterium gnaphalii]GEP09268.1 hypothetical protein MGN01_11130 [Methylobacterium gnaphalii]GJD69048.1 hypothetical protein MMMDOFMJ_1974 [Methylobacterium gnaphalii]GLS50999.1 hypothetical protein GCM10007885_38530 [Methylobacterium gnaphalii]
MRSGAKVQHTKGHTHGRNRHRMVVTGSLLGDAPRIELRIVAKGLTDRWIDMSPAQAREAVRLISDAIAQTENPSSHDSHPSTEAGARGAPGEASTDDRSEEPLHA